MESLQEIALRKVLFRDPYSDTLKHLLMHTVDFNKLSENTISIIYDLYVNDKQIIDRIPSRFISKEGGWYNDNCCYCDLAHPHYSNAYCPAVKMDYDGQYFEDSDY